MKISRQSLNSWLRLEGLSYLSTSYSLTTEDFSWSLLRGDPFFTCFRWSCLFRNAPWARRNRIDKKIRSENEVARIFSKQEVLVKMNPIFINPFSFFESWHFRNFISSELASKRSRRESAGLKNQVHQKMLIILWVIWLLATRWPYQVDSRALM